MIMPDPHDHQLLQGLSRLSMALRLRDSSLARADDLSSLQAQAVLILSQATEPMRLGDLASGLAVTAATASDAVSALVRKGYVSKQPAPDDARSRLLALTGKGSALADKVSSWPDFLSNALVDLDATERAVMCRALIKMIRRLQEAGDVPSGRLCVDCIHFRPHAHEDPRAPHHCAFVDAPFGDGAVRFNCSDHERADAPAREALWSSFVTRAAMDLPQPGEPLP
jgi:DNA-binding MarR family transcriptional regulator